MIIGILTTVFCIFPPNLVGLFVQVTCHRADKLAMRNTQIIIIQYIQNVIFSGIQLMNERRWFVVRTW